MLLRLTILLCVMTCLATAQLRPHFGVTAGVPLTDTLISSESFLATGLSTYFSDYHSVTKRLLIGPAFRLDLPHGLGLEADAIYQRVNFDATTQASQYLSFEQTTENRWQFPFLVSYEHALPLTKTRAFVEFGPAISHIGNGQSKFNALSSGTVPVVNAFSNPGTTQAGVTLGGGVDVRMFHLHLRPQFRYSHWFAANSATAVPVILIANPWATYPLAGPAPNLQTQPNEVSFLLDLLF